MVVEELSTNVEDDNFNGNYESVNNFITHAEEGKLTIGWSRKLIKILQQIELKSLAELIMPSKFTIISTKSKFYYLLIVFNIIYF